MIEASMPTNIALIKYMGKKDSDKNIPDNASLSYTLNNLKTTVKLSPIEGNKDQWESLEDKTRFINHLDFLRAQFNSKQYYKIQSENNFPTGCGLASSASSFAALTECALKAFNINISTEEKAALSRQGSGSSCRSFYAPWALWKGEETKEIELPYPHLIHHVIVVSQGKKLISSSEAHRRVKTSLLYKGRPERAQKRLEDLLKSFDEKNWTKSCDIVWQEFQDMHALFETAEEPFGYMTLGSFFVLNTLRDYWQAHGDGPMITLDAGPNVHLLFRDDQAKLAEILSQAFTERYLVL